jgi:hypothetical protein
MLEYLCLFQEKLESILISGGLHIQDNTQYSVESRTESHKVAKAEQQQV